MESIAVTDLASIDWALFLVTEQKGQKDKEGSSGENVLNASSSFPTLPMGDAFRNNIEFFSIPYILHRFSA